MCKQCEHFLFIYEIPFTTVKKKKSRIKKVMTKSLHFLEHSEIKSIFIFELDKYLVRLIN